MALSVRGFVSGKSPLNTLRVVAYAAVKNLATNDGLIFRRSDVFFYCTPAPPPTLPARQDSPAEKAYKTNNNFNFIENMP